MAGKNVTIEQTGNTLMISSGGEGTVEIEGIPSGFETITVHIPGLAGGTKPLEMVRIVSDMHQIEKPGLFMMGSPDSDPDSSDYEKPQHRAWIRKDYYIGKYEVTQAQWAAVMEGNPWGLPLTPSHFIGNDHPVEKVSWTDCACFCNRLSELDGRTPVYDESTWSMDNEANGYRLPTEAEWENACRAGTTTRYFWGEDPIYTQIVDYAWFHNNSSAETKEVGLKRLNEWSLYDMSGNVSEWCYDKYSNTYYTYENVVDPVGPNTGSYRVARGGSWNDSAGSCRSAYRLIRLPATRGNSIGFRILLPCP